MKGNIPGDSQNLIRYLMSPEAIRERCGQIFALAQKDQLIHFRYHPERLRPTVDYVIAVIQENYPDFRIPYHSRWRHFETGGVDRMAEIAQKLPQFDPLERGRILFELGITSVLLDAGAGKDWEYQEPQTQMRFHRSEGLAIASFHAFLSGIFSSDLQHRFQADGNALANMSQETLAQSFQVKADNPLVGLAGRTSLINQLGQAVLKNPQFFGESQPRLGFLFDYMINHSKENRLTAKFIFETVLQALGSIWPGRVIVQNVNLGDCWSYAPLHTQAFGSDLVPFHKLSQWLSYSLVEPLEDYGILVENLDQLTGLAEYRNGGLFLDLGLLELKNPADAAIAHKPESVLIVEWRAMTVMLLDLVAQEIREVLQSNEQALPLAKVLQGGTWGAGRKIAQELREEGGPPLQLDSDGTVF